MISSFSDAGYLIRCLAHPRARFFERTVLKHGLGQRFLELSGFAQDAAKINSVSNADFLERVLCAERDARRVRSAEMPSRTAGFPALKTLEDYDSHSPAARRSRRSAEVTAPADGWCARALSASASASRRGLNAELSGHVYHSGVSAGVCDGDGAAIKAMVKIAAECATTRGARRMNPTIIDHRP